MITKSKVPALDKSLEIIDFIAANTRVTAKTLSAELNIPIVSVYRILEILSARDYIKEISKIETEYKLGSKILTLAGSMEKNVDIASVAQPFMKMLSILTGQTTQLGVLTATGVKYIAQQLPNKPINIMAGLHIELPVNVSASGKVLLAAMPPPEQKKFIATLIFNKQSEFTITNKNRFLNELQSVAANGYAIDNQEYAIGIGCCAVPISGSSGKTIAALGVTGHWADYSNLPNRNKLVAELQNTALLISRQL